MSLQQTVGPSQEPLTLDAVKQFLKVEHNLEDSLLERLIVSVRQRAEQLTHNQLLTATWKLMVDEFCPVIRLPIAPLLSVTLVQYVDTAGVVQTLNAAEYQVQLSVSRPGMAGELFPAYGKSWPSTRAEREAVRVTFTAGWGGDPESVPGPIVDWMLVQLASRFENRQLVEAGQLTELRFVDSLLEPYKVRTVA